MKKVHLAVFSTIFLMVSLGMAQLKSAPGSGLPSGKVVSAVRSNATQTCTYNFATSGLTFCVTVNGNLGGFASPVEMLNPLGSGASEGYGICDATTGVSYYDYAYADSGNWSAPTTLTNTATEVKIERTTSDGAWTLTQTISLVSGASPYIKVVMAIKNTSGETKNPYLLRFAGILPDGSVNANYDGTLNSAWGYNPTGTGNGPAYGMMLQNVGYPTPGNAWDFLQGLAIDTGTGPNPCNPTANFVGTIVNSQGSVVYWETAHLKKNQTGTVTDRYLGF